MFEGYRIRPVLEWGASDESRELKAFASISEAMEAQAGLLCHDLSPNVERRIFWTLYGVNPEIHGVRTEDAIPDRDSEAAALELLEKLIGSFHVDTGATATGVFTAAGRRSRPTKQSSSKLIDVTLELKLDLALLRKQKRALIGIHEGVQASADQEDAAEGILNMLDCIQDSILDQGLVGEEEIFPREPDLFDVA